MSTQATPQSLHGHAAAAGGWWGGQRGPRHSHAVSTKPTSPRRPPRTSCTPAESAALRWRSSGAAAVCRGCLPPPPPPAVRRKAPAPARGAAAGSAAPLLGVLRAPRPPGCNCLEGAPLRSPLVCGAAENRCLKGATIASAGFALRGSAFSTVLALCTARRRRLVLRPGRDWGRSTPAPTGIVLGSGPPRAPLFKVAHLAAGQVA